MNKLDRIDEYGVKEVPDIYFCNGNGDVLYYSRTVKRVDLYPSTNGTWRGYIETALGNLEDWYKIAYDKDVQLIYFRTFQRNKSTGEDEPLCFVISFDEIVPQSFGFKADSDPFCFPIVFIFKPNKLIFVKDKDCPKCEVSFRQYGPGIYMEEKIIRFVQPERSYKQIKTDLTKERLEELKNACKKSD